MSDLPYSPILPDGQEHLTPWDITSIAPAGSLSSLGAAMYPSANLAMFFPVRVSRTIVTALAFWYNGAAVGHNVDVGIYSADQTKLGSIGSTGQGAVSIIVSAALVVTLGPGLFYIAFACDSASTSFYRCNPNFYCLKVLGAAQQAVFPLPATSTMVTFAYGYVPVFGVTVRSFV